MWWRFKDKENQHQPKSGSCHPQLQIELSIGLDRNHSASTSINIAQPFANFAGLKSVMTAWTFLKYYYLSMQEGRATPPAGLVSQGKSSSGVYILASIPADKVLYRHAHPAIILIGKCCSSGIHELLNLFFTDIGKCAHRLVQP